MIDTFEQNCSNKLIELWTKIYNFVKDIEILIDSTNNVDLESNI